MLDQQLDFDYSQHSQNIASVDKLVGKTGWLSLNKLTIESAEAEDYLIFSGITEEGSKITQEQAERLFSLSATVSESNLLIQDSQLTAQLKEHYEASKLTIIDEISTRNATFFGEEMIKLDAWADDLKDGIERSIKE